LALAKNKTPRSTWPGQVFVVATKHNFQNGKIIFILYQFFLERLKLSIQNFTRELLSRQKPLETLGNEVGSLQVG